MSESTYTVSYLPLVRRRWFRWHARGRISASWAAPGGMERGHFSESRLGAYWRREDAVRRAQDWCVYAERIGRQAGLRVISGVYLHGKPVLLDVSRDPQRHPRGEDGQFIERGERG